MMMSGRFLHVDAFISIYTQDANFFFGFFRRAIQGWNATWRHTLIVDGGGIECDGRRSRPPQRRGASCHDAGGLCLVFLLSSCDRCRGDGTQHK